MPEIWKFNILLLLTVFVVFGCRPPEEETQYNIATFQDPLIGNSCSLEPEDAPEDMTLDQACEMQNGCQAVVDNSDNYLGCMPIPQEDDELPPVDEEQPPVVDGDDDDYTPPAEGDDDYTPPAEGDDDDYTPPAEGDDKDYTPPAEGDDDKDPNDYACGKNGKKVLVCHKAGSHDSHKKCGKPKTLCISINGWENGHSKSKHHEGVDHLGACTEEDLEEEDVQLEIQELLQYGKWNKKR